MKKSFKRWLYSFFAILVIFGAFRLYYRLTDDFRIANITYELPFKSHWTVPDLSPDQHQDLKRILNQTFTYIDKGAQCYAFGSQDGKYVLKFFKFKHLKPSLLVELLPLIPPFKDYKLSCVERKKRKLISVYNGYDLAFRENRQNTKLLYLHLLPTQNLHLKANVLDKMGFERTINLDDVVFLVQKKGETLRTRLRQLLNQQRLEETKTTIAKIIQMYLSEYKMGIYDHDHGVLHNTGFIGDDPFHLDVGKLNKDERMKDVQFYKADLEHVLWKIDVWIKAFYPQYYSEFSNFLDLQYQKWTNEKLNLQAVDPKRFKKKRKLLGF